MIESYNIRNYFVLLGADVLLAAKAHCRNAYSRLAVCEHAMSAVGELLALNHAFEKIKQKAGTSTLNGDGLEIAGF